MRGESPLGDLCWWQGYPELDLPQEAVRFFGCMLPCSSFPSCLLSRVDGEPTFGIQGAVRPLEVGLQQFSGSVVVLADRGAGRGHQVPTASCLSRSHPLMLQHQLSAILAMHTGCWLVNSATSTKPLPSWMVASVAMVSST